jgi:hypothetical protein
MNKKLIFSGILVCLLIFSLALIGCDNGTTGGGSSGNPPGEAATGTFRIKFTNIPPEVMASNQTLIGLYPANTGTYVIDGGLAGRDTALPWTEDDIGANSYECYMYLLGNSSTKYESSAGNYDIAFIITGTNEKRAIKNHRLEVNKLNTIDFNSFKVVP